jgi:hypothetical protein
MSGGFWGVIIANNISELVLGGTWTIFIGFTFYKIGRWRGKKLRGL